MVSSTPDNGNEGNGEGGNEEMCIRDRNTWFLFFYDYFSQPGFCPNRGFF